MEDPFARLPALERRLFSQAGLAALNNNVPEELRVHSQYDYAKDVLLIEIRTADDVLVFRGRAVDGQAVVEVFIPGDWVQLIK